MTILIGKIGHNDHFDRETRQNAQIHVLGTIDHFDRETRQNAQIHALDPNSSIRTIFENCA